MLRPQPRKAERNHRKERLVENYSEEDSENEYQAVGERQRMKHDFDQNLDDSSDQDLSTEMIIRNGMRDLLKGNDQLNKVHDLKELMLKNGANLQIGESDLVPSGG